MKELLCAGAQRIAEGMLGKSNVLYKSGRARKIIVNNECIIESI